MSAAMKSIFLLMGLCAIFSAMDAAKPIPNKVGNLDQWLTERAKCRNTLLEMSYVEPGSVEYVDLERQYKDCRARAQQAL